MSFAPYRKPPGALQTREKSLFFAIWGILAIAVCLWKFWPGSHSVSSDSFKPEVRLGDSLSIRFHQAQVTESRSSHYRIGLTWNQTYRETLRGHSLPVHFTVEFFASQDTPLYSTTASLSLDPSVDSIDLVVENPKRIFARTLRLNLAH